MCVLIVSLLLPQSKGFCFIVTSFLFVREQLQVIFHIDFHSLESISKSISLPKTRKDGKKMNHMEGA